MTASTANAAGFLGSTALVAPVGTEIIPVEVTVPTTSLDDASDRYNLLTIPEGRTLVGIDFIENGDGDVHATPTLDADLVLVQGVDDPSEDGTETILYNTGSALQAASTTRVYSWVNTKLTEKGKNGKAYIRFKVNTAAATAAALALKFLVHLR